MRFFDKVQSPNPISKLLNAFRPFVLMTVFGLSLIYFSENNYGKLEKKEDFDITGQYYVSLRNNFRHYFLRHLDIIEKEIQEPDNNSKSEEIIKTESEQK